MRVRHPEKFAKLGGGKGLPFTPFGSVDEIYSREALFDSEIDRIAQIMNAKWFVKDDQMPTEEDIRQHWREASFFNRESSRASAMGVRNLWRLSGCAAREKETAKARKKEKEALERAGKTVPDEKPETEEARLARRQAAWKAALQGKRNLERRLEDAEHRRWMAFHLVRGVRPWDWRTEPDLWMAAGGKVKANLRVGANRHAALVPTARLPELELWLETTYWRNAAEDATTAGRTELAACFAKYAEEVAARKVPEEGQALVDYTADYRLWLWNKCVWVFDLWNSRKKKMEPGGFAADAERQVERFVAVAFSGNVPEKPVFPSRMLMPPETVRQAAFPAWRSLPSWLKRTLVVSWRMTPLWMKKWGGLALRRLARMEQKALSLADKAAPERARGRKHGTPPVTNLLGKMDAVRAYKTFLVAADGLFGKAGKGEGAEFEPDWRFRTPGDMVDNDARIVMHVPEYLGNQSGT